MSVFAGIIWAVKKVGDIYNYLIEIENAIAERMAEVSMGLFIAFQGGNEDVAKKLLDIQWTILKGYAFLIPPQIWMIYAYPDIVRSPVLQRFINQSRYLSTAYLYEIERRNKPDQQFWSDMILASLIAGTPFGQLYNIIDMILSNGAELFKEAVYQVWNMWQKNDKNTELTMAELSQRYERKADDLRPFFVAESKAIELAPLLPFYWTNLKSFIAQFYTYFDIYNEGLWREKPDPRSFIDTARLYFDERLIKTTWIDFSGEIEFKLKKLLLQALDPTLICVDVAGLRSCRLMKVIPEWGFHLINAAGEDVYMNEPEYVDIEGIGENKYLVKVNGWKGMLPPGTFPNDDWVFILEMLEDGKERITWIHTDYHCCATAYWKNHKLWDIRCGCYDLDLTAIIDTRKGTVEYLEEWDESKIKWISHYSPNSTCLRFGGCR